MKIGRQDKRHLRWSLFERDISPSTNAFASRREGDAEIVYHSAIQIYYSLLENIVKPGQWSMGGSTGGRRCYRLLSTLDRALDLALYSVITALLRFIFSFSRDTRFIFTLSKRFSTKGKFYDVSPGIDFIYKFGEPDFRFIISENNS